MSDTYLKCLVGLECQVGGMCAVHRLAQYVIVDVCPNGKEAILLHRREGFMRRAEVTQLYLTEKSKERLLDKLTRDPTFASVVPHLGPLSG